MRGPERWENLDMLEGPKNRVVRPASGSGSRRQPNHPMCDVKREGFPDRYRFHRDGSVLMERAMMENVVNLTGEVRLAQDSATRQTEAAIVKFLVDWNKLVSMTNWEKGKIIFLWRKTLQESGAQSSEYSDDVWSRRVGNVSSQHVGRLRRVYERFGTIHAAAPYQKLFWSHFQASLDWLDAETWLVSAANNDWSVQKMRAQRWEALGFPADQKPDDRDIVTEEKDSDSTFPELTNDASDNAGIGKAAEIHGFGDDDDADGGKRPKHSEDDESDCPFDTNEERSPRGSDDSRSEGSGPVRPFEHLPPLPADLQEATELFKLAILAHKMTGWSECSSDVVVKVLAALKTLALSAPDNA